MSLDSAEDGDGARLADQLSTSEGLWAGPADLEHEVSLRHDLGRFVALLPPALRRCCAILMSGSVGEAIQKENLHRSSYYEALAVCGAGLVTLAFTTTWATPTNRRRPR